MLADPNEVRIVAGQHNLAHHRRSQGAQIEDAAHIQALVEQKHAARQHRGADRLSHVAPASKTLLIRAAERGSNLGSITGAMLRLLDRYGAAELQAAIIEAIDRNVPHPSAVRLALERRRHERQQLPPIAVNLTDHVQVRDVAVRPPRLELITSMPCMPERRRCAFTASSPIDTTPPPPDGLIEWEEQERARRSLVRRLKDAHIGRFKPLCDFDWKWPKRCDQAAIEALMSLEFLNDATNAILVGPNGIGKSTLAKNIAHQAVIHGHTVLFTTAGQLLGDLAALDSDTTLRRRLRHYVNPTLLVIDEVGYLSYSNRHADLLFELISRRYENKSTLVTTNRPFAEWREVFPTAACVASLIDRLVHHAEIIAIDGESYRLKEATERSDKRGRQRRGAKP